MRVNKKAKAEYYDECNTMITVNQKKISIKPPLPTKDEEIAKRYSRPNEDIAYKIMKLANLVNRFAHMTENEELKNELYDTKLDLIERVIDLATKNPKIKVKRNFDEAKMATSIILEIPGYNMIALHIMKKNSSLLKKSNELPESEIEIAKTSTILVPGVNRELLLTMKKMSIEERKELLLNLDSNTFYKLVLRMGYNMEEGLIESKRKEFLESMVSDEKIDELLSDEQER